MGKAPGDEVGAASACTSDDGANGVAARRRTDPEAASDGLASHAQRCQVALLCPEERLRRLLRLSLLTDGYDIVEWGGAVRPPDPWVAAVVADLDSLGRDVPDVLALLGAWGVADETSFLFISVYPLDPRGLPHSGPYDALQPPFSPEELTDRVRHLLDRAATNPAGRAPPGAPRRDAPNCATADLDGR